MELFSLSGTTILVLGGTGFLGTHLVQALLNHGAKVRVFNRFPSKFNLQSPRLEFYAGNFAEGSGFEHALKDVDVVYHLISTTIPSISNKNPIRDVQSNLVGTLQLLQKMQEMQVKRIIFLSSGGTVYGTPLFLPVPENHPLQPLCSYGIVKVAIENYWAIFSKFHGFKTTILRLSNPYGIYQTDIGVQGIISTLFNKIINAEKIQIWGDGSVVRDYIYISDVIAVMLQILKMDKTGVYNIGTGIGHSLNEILSIVSSVTGKQACVEYLPSRLFDVHKIFLDICKVKEEIGWKPQVSLEEGCKKYWKLLNNDKQKSGDIKVSAEEMMAEAAL